MDHTTGKLQAADGLELYYQRWHPDSAPRASIAVLHGIGGHSGQSTYTHLINHLVPLGYSLYGLDLRGHGASAGRRGHIGEFRQYLDDLEMTLEHVRRADAEADPMPLFYPASDKTLLSGF